MVCVEGVTRWVVAEPFLDLKANPVAYAIFNKIQCMYGTPQICTDNGACRRLCYVRTHKFGGSRSLLFARLLFPIERNLREINTNNPEIIAMLRRHLAGKLGFFLASHSLCSQHICMQIKQQYRGQPLLHGLRQGWTTPYHHLSITHSSQHS